VWYREQSAVSDILLAHSYLSTRLQGHVDGVGHDAVLRADRTRSLEGERERERERERQRERERERDRERERERERQRERERERGM
jgi:hypothetical protein